MYHEAVKKLWMLFFKTWKRETKHCFNILVAVDDQFKVYRIYSVIILANRYIPFNVNTIVQEIGNIPPVPFKTGTIRS